MENVKEILNEAIELIKDRSSELEDNDLQSTREAIISLTDIITELDGEPKFQHPNSLSIEIYAKQIKFIGKNIPELSEFVNQKDKSKNYAMAYLWLEDGDEKIYFAISSEIPELSNRSK